MTIEWPKVYFGKNGWTFTAVIDGRLVERNIGEYHAMGLAESILAMSNPATAQIHKDASQERQKRMIAEHFHRLAQAPDTGHKYAYTFVPGNLTELLRTFDVLPVLPEINALQSGRRGRSADYIARAEKAGHSEDVCTYVKCDIGMSAAGNVGPTGERIPDPDLLLLSYTGCFTFMKWFELLREHYDCPTVFLQIPYQGDGTLAPEHRQYVGIQIRGKLSVNRMTFLTLLMG